MSLKHNDIPSTYENHVLPDTYHVFHAYEDNGYVWVKIYDTVRKSSQIIGSYPKRGDWRHLLRTALGLAMNKYPAMLAKDYIALNRAKRFYRSDFVAK